MANVVAHIRLANGETGYYDDKSGIFLNWSHPEADVTDDMDLSGLRVSRCYHRIKVLSGSLGKPKSFKHILAEAKAKRLGVPVEHILHKGKKQAVYVEQAESPAKTEAPKAEKKVAAEVKEEAKAEGAKIEAAAAEEAETAAKAEAEGAAEKAADEKKAPAKKTTRRRKTTKKATDTEEK